MSDATFWVKDFTSRSPIAKPILFNTEMVRAILDDRKTVTRRVVKPQPRSKLAYCCMGHKHGTWSYPGKDAWKYWDDESFRLPDDLPDDEKDRYWTPPYRADDILYVRETWAKGYDGGYIYRADDKLADLSKFKDSTKMIYRPSIHMPREAARIFLRVTDVRVERLQDITEAQALKEGAVQVPYAAIVDDVDGKTKSGVMQTAIQNFAGIWDGTIKPADRALYGWDVNPWVWVIEFERCEKPEEGGSRG